MKARLPYMGAALTLLLAELLIGCFLHDRLLRPYGGDVLATALLCCIARCLFPRRHHPGTPLLAAVVFGIGVVTELLQYADLANRLGLHDGVLRILLGSTFDPADILCYGLGCVLFWGAEWGLYRFLDRHRDR